MFDNKKVDIIQNSDGYFDEMGTWHDGIESITRTIYVDVQPYSKELAYREYGYNEEVCNRMFVDNTIYTFKLGDTVKFEDTNYIVKKILEWDGFQEVLINNEQNSK